MRRESITIPDKPTEESIKSILSHLMLCTWRVPDQTIIGSRMYWRIGIRWEDILDLDFDVLPVPNL